MSKKTVLITGANRGIGLKLVEHYLDNDHTVLATARNLRHAEQLINLKERNHDRLQLAEVDVSFDASVEQMVKCFTGVDHIDVLINNAGVFKGPDAKLDDVDLQAVRDQFEVNVIGPMRVARAVDKWLRASAQPVVVQVSSKMGSIQDNTSGGAYGYRISKNAVNMFNKSLAIEWPHAICIAMHPGWVATDMGGKDAPTSAEESAAGIAKVIAKLQKDDTGKFFDFRGEKIPW